MRVMKGVWRLIVMVELESRSRGGISARSTTFRLGRVIYLPSYTILLEKLQIILSMTNLLLYSELEESGRFCNLSLVCFCPPMPSLPIRVSARMVWGKKRLKSPKKNSLILRKGSL
ncbi:MAG: hypothetical protein ACTSPQ_21460 [Candidatus Helarchaeota archaeon]